MEPASKVPDEVVNVRTVVAVVMPIASEDGTDAVALRPMPVARSMSAQALFVLAAVPSVKNVMPFKSTPIVLAEALIPLSEINSLRYGVKFRVPVGTELLLVVASVASSVMLLGVTHAGLAAAPLVFRNCPLVPAARRTQLVPS